MRILGAILCGMMLTITTWGADCRLALFDFTDKSDTVSPDCRKLTLLVFAELSSRRGISLVEREQLDKVIKERHLAAAALVQGKYAEVAGVFRADYGVIGCVYQLDRRQVINLKLIQLSTGDVTGNSFVSSRDDVDLEKSAVTMVDFIVAKLNMPSSR